NTDDPAKLSAALEQLEAEKQRRTDEKVERGEAVRVPRDFTGELVIGLPRPKSEIEALIRKSERDQIARSNCQIARGRRAARDLFFCRADSYYHWCAEMGERGMRRASLAALW